MEKQSIFYYEEATAKDNGFMEKILLEAAAASGDFITAEELDSHPDTARYVRGWPRDREMGIIVRTNSQEPAGVAWICQFSHLEEKGPDGLIPPEITVGVLSQHRNLGLGDELLQKLYKLAAQRGLKQLSLGVHKDNHRARRLYDKHNWRLKKIFGDYILMVKDL